MCERLCIVKLKQHFSQTLVRPSSITTLPKLFQHSNVGIGVIIYLLGITSTSIIPSQSQKIMIMTLSNAGDYLIFLPGRLRMGTSQIVSLSPLQNDGPMFHIQDRKDSLSASTCQQLGRNGCSLGFVFNCEAPRNPLLTYLWIYEIMDDMTSIYFAISKTHFQLSICSIGSGRRVKHFRVSVMRFSARVSWHTGVVTKAVTIKISQHGVLRC